MTKAMALPFGTAIFLGIFLGGLLLHRAEERYRVESLFHESEKKYRELVEGTSDLITHTDNDGNITFANRVSEKIFGFSPEECVGMSAFQFIHPDDRARTREWFDKCVAQKKQQANIENRQVNAATGRRIPFCGRPRFDTTIPEISPGWRHRPGHDRNPRSRKRTSETCSRKCPTAARSTKSSGTTTESRWIIGSSASIPPWKEYRGLTKKRSPARPSERRIPEAQDHLLAMYGQTATSGESTAFEHYIEELDKHFDITVYSPAENQVAAILQDITPRKKAEEEKKAYEEQIRHGQKMEAIGTAVRGDRPRFEQHPGTHPRLCGNGDDGFVPRTTSSMPAWNGCRKLRKGQRS